MFRRGVVAHRCRGEGTSKWLLALTKPDKQGFVGGWYALDGSLGCRELCQPGEQRVEVVGVGKHRAIVEHRDPEPNRPTRGPPASMSSRELRCGSLRRTTSRRRPPTGIRAAQVGSEGRR